MRPLIELLAEPDGWAKLIDRYDHYSLLGYLIEQGRQRAAISLLGPLFNLEGRFHFSLVEWFSHCHEDVFGDLEYIDDGADTLAERVRAGADARRPARGGGPRDRAGPRRRRRPLPGRRRHRGLRHRRRVHRDRPDRAAAAHGDQRPRRRQVRSRSGTSTTVAPTRSSCSSAAAGGSTTTRSPTA